MLISLLVLLSLLGIGLVGVALYATWLGLQRVARVVVGSH